MFEFKFEFKKSSKFMWRCVLCLIISIAPSIQILTATTDEESLVMEAGTQTTWNGFKQRIKHLMKQLSVIIAQKKVAFPLLIAGSLIAGGIATKVLLQPHLNSCIEELLEKSKKLTQYTTNQGPSEFEHLLDTAPNPSVIQPEVQLQNNDIVRPHEIAMVTLSTPNRDGFARITEANQREYAQQHGYHFIKYTSSFCKERPEEWSKVVAMAKQAENKGFKWLLWIDDDIVITDKSKKLEQLITTHGTGKDFIVAQDADRQRTPINNGIFLLRNSEWSRKFLTEVWYEGKKRNYLERGRCLLEQQTMADLITENPTYGQRVTIVPQRTMNSFVRSPSMYPNDPYDSKWQFGDFAAHATGWNGGHEKRRRVIELLASQQCQTTNYDSLQKKHDCLDELDWRSHGH